MAQQKVENRLICHTTPPEAFYKPALKFWFCFWASLLGRFCASCRGDWRGYGLDSPPGRRQGPRLCWLGYALLTKAICQWPLTPEFSLLHCLNAQGIWACLYQPCSCRSTACWVTPCHLGRELAQWLDHLPSCLISGRVGHMLCPSPLPPRREGQAACLGLCSPILITSQSFCLSPANTLAWPLVGSLFSSTDSAQSAHCPTLQMFHHDIFTTYYN